MIYENQLEDLKKKLYRLHFLLTEKEDEKTFRESLQQFRSCYIIAMSELSTFLSTEYALKPKNNFEIVEVSFEQKLFNKDMSDELKKMVLDFEKLDSVNDYKKIYREIKESYSGNLQIIHDMLSRMGQDAEEE